MLLQDNFTLEHILNLRKKTGVDPSILERTIFAFGLLEAIRKVGMPFIFKGGTSLLVLLNKPKRLSTDIDIIARRETDIDKYIEQAGQIFPFIKVEEHKRKGNTNIEKRHFRFYFLSPRTNKEINILLDVVYEDNPYISVIECPIRNQFLKCDKNDLLVTVPNKNCLLGDKLTAFAPHTTGIPFGIDKELEIIKQLFDCYTLFQEMDDYEMVCKTYNKVANIEKEYRELSISVDDCLKDTIESCICVIGRGSIRQNEYRYFSLGIEAIQGHVFEERVNGENAITYASEILYLATCILTKQLRCEPITDYEIYRNAKLNIKGIKKISGMRNANPLAYAYIIKSIQILNENKLYIDGIE